MRKTLTTKEEIEDVKKSIARLEWLLTGRPKKEDQDWIKETLRTRRVWLSKLENKLKEEKKYQTHR